MKKRIIFFLIIILTFNIPLIYSATDEGYGEANDNLGQFVDSFEDLDNVTVIDDLVRNATYNYIELNSTIGLSYNDFNYGVEIIIDHDRIDSNLVRFPILLNISDSSGIGNDDMTAIFDEIGDSYLKIAITDVSQSIEYYVDVEYWNRIEESAYLWIGINVSSSSNTTIRMFFDSSASNNTDYIGLSGSDVASNVWDEYFILVYHFSESSGDFLDSTENNYDGDPIGNGIIRDNYIIDGGIDLDGTSDYVSVNTAGIDGGLDELSVEIWLNSDGFGGADKAPIGSWGDAGTTFLLYYDKDPNDIWRMLFSDSNGGTKHGYFGDSPPSDGLMYYMSITYKRSDFVRGYQNAVKTVGSATDNFPTATTTDKIGIGAEFAGGVKDWVGKLDEVRISNTTRSDNWINATYYSGRDDLVDWLSVSGSVYEIDGYLITNDYLNYSSGSCLTFLTSTNISLGTSITVQFSNDNETWVDNEGNVGSNTLLDGFYALDLRDLNYTDLYSLVNFTGTVLVSPILWQLRVVTTLGVCEDDIIISGGINASGLLIVIFLLSIASALIYGVSRRK